MNRCHPLRKKLFISGFVEACKSRLNLQSAIKRFVFVICTAGFFYQTWAFLQLFLTYPTVQDVSEEYPVEIRAPAITICNNNRFSLKLLCKKYSYECIWGNTSTLAEFCERHKRRCDFRHDTWYEYEGLNFEIALFDGDYQTDHSNEFLDDVGPQDDEFIASCYITNWNKSLIFCKTNMIQAARNGFPYKCFSIMSLLGKKNKEPKKLSFIHDYVVRLNMHPEDYIDDNDLVQAYVAIHDPRKMVNPMMEGVPLKAGKEYKLYPTMEIKVSLPPPYASKCIDYLDKWKKNGGYGPLSKKDCFDTCIIDGMIKEYDCVGQEVTYPNRYDICFSKWKDITPNMLKTCHSLCEEACEEISYRFDVDVTMDNMMYRECDPRNERCINSVLTIFVSFKRMTIEKIQLFPRIESIELFSYIGGYLGMWLGISLASTFDFVQSLYSTIYPLLKGKRKKKMTTPTEELRLQTV